MRFDVVAKLQVSVAYDGERLGSAGVEAVDALGPLQGAREVVLSV